jgi:hypothetical protein
MANRNVSFTFSRNPTAGDVTKSMRLVITDASNNVIVAQDLAEWVTNWATPLAEGTGYTATLTAYSGLLHTGQPCPVPAVRVFDVPALPPPPVPGNPTLDAPVIS